jgi:hypothetical protein
MRRDILLFSYRRIVLCLTIFSLAGVGSENQDFCTDAAGPRPLNSVASPGSTVGASIDDVNGGFCGDVIDTPGIWWWVNGTGEVIRASSCDERTQMKVKISVFTGSCGALRCVTGHSRPDFECPVLARDEDGAWGTISTALDFPTFKGQHYYILVQQASISADAAGTVWMKFRPPGFPQNDACIDAIGPVPRDDTMIIGTTEDGSVTVPEAGVCLAFDYYPGVWYQVFGTGGTITLSACSEFNFDGFFFSVYNGANCDDMTCVDGTYQSDITDQEKCVFGPSYAERPKTTFSFNSRDRDRYYVMVHYARTQVEKPTSPFRFYVDDGAGGNAGSGGVTGFQFESAPASSDGDGNGDGGEDGNNGNSNGNGNSGAVAVGCGLGMILSFLSFFLL